MSKEIFEVTLSGAPTFYVEANTKNQAIRAAYSNISAKKLTGSEVRGLPAGTDIISADGPENLDLPLPPADFNPGL